MSAIFSKIKSHAKKYLDGQNKGTDVETSMLDSTTKFNICYEQLRAPKSIGYNTIPVDEFLRQLNDYAEVSIKDFQVDKEEYDKYILAAGYNNYGGYSGMLDMFFHEKTLEHFVAAKLLNLNNNDIYIDIATSGSPAPSIYSKLFGVKSYKQDLIFQEGLYGDTIGGDAANMPIPPEFADKMALHCSFEHFEGDADIRFVHEAARVLKPNGAVCILPLYTSQIYNIVTDPVVAINENVHFEEGVHLSCIENGGNRHGRSYNAEQFVERICKQVDKGQMKLEVYRILGAKQISPNCYLSLAVLLTNTA